MKNDTLEQLQIEKEKIKKALIDLEINESFPLDSYKVVEPLLQKRKVEVDDLIEEWWGGTPETIEELEEADLRNPNSLL